MIKSRPTAAFILPGLVLFVGLTVLLFHSPALAPSITLLFFCFVLATGVVISLEIAAVFAVFVTLIELAGMAVIRGPDKAALGGEILVLWAALYLVQRFAARDLIDDERCSEGLQDRQATLQELHKEKLSLERRSGDLSAQGALTAQLSSAVHQFSGLLDPMKVRQRLLEFVRATIHGGTVHYFAGTSPRDPLDKWVMDRKVPLLVTDMEQDSRFNPLPAHSEVRSVLAAPVVVERRMVGILRLNAFEPQIFSVGDLRALDALSVLAALALENLQLSGRVGEAATDDALTGLMSERHFRERLAEEILRAGRFQMEFSLMRVEIDQFDRYGEAYGTSAGDLILQRVAELLRKTLRPVDLAARFEEHGFVVLFPQTGLAPARALAEQFNQGIREEIFSFGAEETMQERIGIRLGLAEFPRDATTVSQILRAAESRLGENV